MAINEERSYTEYNVEVPTTDFPIGFDILDDGLDVVEVTLNDVDPTTLGYTVIQVNNTTYRFAPAVPSGVVRLTRVTDIDNMAHVFTEGAIFISENMDGNFKQIRHAQQEVRDYADDTRSTVTAALGNYESGIEGVEATTAVTTIRLNNEITERKQADTLETQSRVQGDLDNRRYAEDLLAMGNIWDGISTRSVLDTELGLNQQQINDLTGTPYRVKASGYNIGERVVLENGDIVKSTVANNTVNPNFDMTGWENEFNHNSSYDLMTGSQIQDVKDGVSSFDASGIIQSLITNPDEGDATIKRGTYFIGSSGIQLTGVKDKKITFEKGVVFKWHPLVTFSSNAYMFKLTDCENIAFDDMVLRGANNPSIWVKTEKVIRAGLIDKQTGVLQINCKKIKFNAPDIQNFQWGIYTLASSANKSSNIEINDGYLTGNYCGIVWESYIIDGITSCDILNTRSNNNWKWGMWMEAGDLSKDSRYIRNIKMIGGSLSGQVEEHGCYVQGEDHLFSGVDIENNNSAGLRMYSCARLRVIGNKFTGNGFNANGIGYLSGAAFIGTDTDGSAEPIRSNNVIISDNVSTGNRFTFADYKLDNSIIVANNVCTGNGTADGLSEGDIVFRSNQNSKISNNIIRDSLCATGILVRDQGNSMSKNIDVNDNMVIGQKGIGIKYLWGASETDSEMIRIRGNTVKGSTSHGILVELKTRETRFVEITGNNTQYNGGDGIKTFVGATASCSIMRVTDNSSTFNTGYGLNFNGVSGGLVYGLLEKNNHAQRNNSNGVQIFQPATGGASYGTSQLVASGMRRTVTFSLKDVAVAASGEIQLKLDGVIPYGKNSVGVRVKAIEFFLSKGITGGSLSATVRAHTGVGTGTNLLSASLTTTITSGKQDASVTNAMNASSDRIPASSRYYVGVDMDNPVVAGGGTVDLLCNLILDYSDDWRFEVAL